MLKRMLTLIASQFLESSERDDLRDDEDDEDDAEDTLLSRSLVIPEPEATGARCLCVEEDELLDCELWETAAAASDPDEDEDEDSSSEEEEFETVRT